MSYFHVLVSESAAPEEFKCIAQDLAESALKTLFLKPYRKGRPIVSGGRIYPQTELRGIKIIKTEEAAEGALAKAGAEVDRAYKEMNNDLQSGVFIMPFLGYGLNEISDVGVDVTAEYIKFAPGEGGTMKALSLVVNQAWITGIGTAVLASTIIAWLKLG